LKKKLNLQNDVIQLGEALWGDSKKGNFLLNREFQVGVDLANTFLQNPETVLLAGSKGIGKSCLGLVIISTLLEKDCTVVYEVGDTKLLLIPTDTALYTFRNNFKQLFNSYEFTMLDNVGVYEFIADNAYFFEKLKLSPKLVHVMDLGELDNVSVSPNHPQIIITSPNSEKLNRHYEVDNNNYVVIYPPWTWDEIKKLNLNLREQSKQEEEVLKLKFELFGGIPRQIFKNETIDQVMKRIEKAVNEVSLDTWKQALTCSSYALLPKQVPGVFVHITKHETGIVVRFASEYILNLVIRKHCHSNRAALANLFMLLNE
jgi:hypothetical protein